MADYQRAETAILAILEIAGLILAIYGLYAQFGSNVSLTGIFYCSIWYIFTGVSFFLGLVSIFFSGSEGDLDGNSETFLEYHYFLAWLAVVIGYPLMVTFTWLKIYPAWAIPAQAHILLSIIPLLAILSRSSQGITRSTQICTGIAAISHFAVCFVANDIMGYAAAAAMIVTNISFSTPTRYHIWAFNSRELFVIGLAATSVLMYYSIIHLDSKK